MRWMLAGLVAAGVAAGAARAAEDPPALRALRDALPAGTTLTARVAEERDGALHLTDARLANAKGALTAARAVLRDAGRGGVRLLEAEGLALTDGTRAASVTITGLVVPPDPAMVEAWRLTEATLRGLETPGPEGLSLARLRVSGIGPGLVARAALEGLALRLGPGPVERVALPRATLEATELLPQARAMLDALEGRPVPEIPPSRYALRGEDLAVEGGGKRLGGVATIRLEGASPPGEPARGLMALEGMEVTGEGPAAPLLAQAGLRNLAGDFLLEARVEEASGRYAVSSRLAVREVAALGLGLGLSGFTPEGAQAGLPEAALVSARLRFEEESLLARLAEAAGRDRKLPPARIRAEWAAAAEAALADPPRQRGALAPVRAPVLRVLRGEARVLELAANPPAPLGREAFAALNPADLPGLVRALGLTASAR